MMMIIILLIVSFICSVRSSNWIKTDIFNDNAIVKFTLVLEQQNINILEDYVLDISDPESDNYGNYFTKEQVIDIVRTDSEKLKLELNEKGVYYQDVGDALRCEASVQFVEEFFNVIMDTYYNRKTEEIIYKTSDIIIVPEGVMFVSGLDNKFMNYKHFNEKSKNSKIEVDGGFVAREVLEKLYDLGNATITHPNVSAGAIEYDGGGYSEVYINASQVYNGVKSRPLYKSIGQNEGGGVESELDLDMLADTAGDVQLWYMDYDVWMYGIAMDVFNSLERPLVLSVSYGWAEWAQCQLISCGNLTAQEYITRANGEFVKLAALGVTVVVASGDAGAPGRTNEGCDTGEHEINPIYPSSSPWVTSVGATFVVANGDKDTFTPLLI